MGKPRRLGIFGGTFNPVHLGHLRTAEEIREELELDRVWFVPAASPPHKRGDDLAPARHRMAMVRLAVADNPAFEASALEVRRRGRSYSVDTLRQLRRRFGSSTELFFVLGLDAFLEIETWKEYEKLFTLCHLVVTTRPPRTQPELRSELFPVAVRGEFCYEPGQKGFVHREGKRVLFRSVTALDISASRVRQLLRAGKSVRYLVPDTVAAYIARHRLYEPRVPRP
ncbi:MAG: putative nicotinate-nucleotide adenylyltransferase [Candidatus Binatia bacterium]|nr:MAG: putative nicotinate-nucleotide adenylyltransferase [Candidatus Binatia bacterium]